MENTILHITNGGSLTDYLKELDFKGHILTWHEMLCEGSTTSQIDTTTFLNLRKAFLSTYYDIEIDEYQFHNELSVLDDVSSFSKIVLWFEYDLFCHINLLAVISLLKEKAISLPIYLVCSGHIEGERNLKGLSELNQKQLFDHFDSKILLTEEDIDLAITIWRIYCGKDHNLLKPYVTKKSSFKYLNNCIKAHFGRFPDIKSGLSILEKNILSIIKDNDINSRHHLLGYILNYQGYYGYGDTQINRLIDNLVIFFNETETGITLNRKGHEALLSSHNFALEINNNISYGGINRLDYYYSEERKILVKNPVPCPLKNLNLY
ncbi:DUF1835 domain-containing protein [Hanstruepera neustonica]|uniref:DUF1835 domain-containing protein n=1 Tax=Hanstruepera neustonica TaxID=1445657 RepID=A0A2K1DYK0_9FLAO|nr:DUF1835 domain-containing protein [Hanstruepera neustonica]PNQ73107.1 DUF1835 domain-containing protein [Hanstruepera neustonica]